MANEILTRATLNVTKNNAAISMDGTKQMDMAGNTFIGNVQTVGLTTEALLLGDVSSMGYLFLKNLDATNFCMFSLVSPAASGGAFCTLKAGEFAVIPTRQTTIYAIADTAPVNVQVGACSL